MAFSDQQTKQLQAKLSDKYVKSRDLNGITLSYVEGWHVISEANRIFGFDAWDRASVNCHCVWQGEEGGRHRCVYAVKVRITVRAGESYVVREGTGTGEASSYRPGDAHDIAIKAAETDATKRALATFGNPFGLALYDKEKAGVRKTRTKSGSKQIASKLNGVPIAEPKRLRHKEHLKFVASQPCLICDRRPAQAHHIRFAQPRALGRKVSDEFTVPLCATHHMKLHQTGDERAWWAGHKLDPLQKAARLWQQTMRSSTELEKPI